jgi:hypothetical protein
MMIWSKLDRADKMAAVTAIASVFAWWYFKGRKYL